MRYSPLFTITCAALLLSRAPVAAADLLVESAAVGVQASDGEFYDTDASESALSPFAPAVSATTPNAAIAAELDAQWSASGAWMDFHSAQTGVQSRHDERFAFADVVLRFSSTAPTHVMLSGLIEHDYMADGTSAFLHLWVFDTTPSDDGFVDPILVHEYHSAGGEGTFGPVSLASDAVLPGDRRYSLGFSTGLWLSVRNPGVGEWTSATALHITIAEIPEPATGMVLLTALLARRAVRRGRE